MTTTPRRTVRFSDEEWTAGHVKAKAEGQTLTEVLRRLLGGYLVGNVHGLDDYAVEYRAVPGDTPSRASRVRHLEMMNDKHFRKNKYR